MKINTCNRSDHCAIEVETNIRNNESETMRIEPIKRNQIDWDDQRTRAKYNQSIGHKLDDLVAKVDKIKLNDSDENIKEEIEQNIKKLYEILLEASENSCKVSLNDKNSMRTNEWWNNETKRLNKVLKKLETDSNSLTNTTKQNEEIKQAKRNFERAKAANIKSIENDELYKLSQLLKLNRKRFWKSLKKKLRKQKEVTVLILKLECEFKSLFNDKLINQIGN